jgi:hypothetical protein
VNRQSEQLRYNLAMPSIGFAVMTTLGEVTS